MDDNTFLASSGYRNAQILLCGLGTQSGAVLLDQVFGPGASDRFNSSALFSDPDPLGWVGITTLSDEQLQGHPGAFTSSFLDGSPEILLNGSWLRSASVDAVTGVILEEFGHAIDWVVNGDRDTPGDEGLWFSNRLMAAHGLNYSTLGRPHNDHGTLRVGSISLDVEFATSAGFTTTGIAPASWSSATSGLSDGSVDLDSAPASITINGSNNGSGSPETVDYSTNSVITAPGFAVYDWDYTNFDSEYIRDSFGTLIDGTTYSSLSSSAFGIQTKTGQLTSFFTTPTSFGFRALSNDGLTGNIVANISNFKFKQISDAYYVRFNNLFAAVNDGGNADTGALISSNVWILPDDPTADPDFRTNFADNGSGGTKRVWLISDAINNGQPLALYLTNGVDTVGTSAKDRWIFNTVSDGSGTSYIASSGSDTTTANNTGLNLPRVGTIALSDLDDLRAEQNDTTPPTVSSVALSDWRLKSGDTTQLTIVFSEEVSGFSDAVFSNIVQIPNLSKSGTLTTSDNITFTVLLAPNATEAPSNQISVDVSQLTDTAGNAGSNTASRFSENYTVDTIPPALTGIYFHLTGGTAASALSSPILYGQVPYLYFQFREPVYNLRLQDLNVTGGKVTALEVCNTVNGNAAPGTEETSTLYRARFTPSPIISNSIPVWARLNSFSDRAEATIDGYSYLTSANTTGNINISTTSSAANLRFSIDNTRPFATFLTPPTTLTRGSVRAIQLDMSEEVRTSGLGSLGISSFQVSGGGRVASVRQLSKTRWELLLVAPRYAGDFTLSIIPGSFLDINGNTSMADKRFRDRLRIRAI